MPFAPQPDKPPAETAAANTPARLHALHALHMGLVAWAVFALTACSSVTLYPSGSSDAAVSFIRAQAEFQGLDAESPADTAMGVSTFPSAPPKTKVRRLTAQGYQASDPALGDFVSAYTCGWRKITIGRTGMGLRLVDGASVFNLDPESNAQGSAFSAQSTAGSARVVFHNSLVASIDVNGEALPHCVLTHDGHMQSFQALGHEPAWALTSDAHLTQFTIADRTYSGLSTDVQTLALDKPWRVGPEPDAPEVNVHHRLCRDTATGMPFPYTVEVVYDGQLRMGCGGQTSALLTGRTWTVTAVDGSITQHAAASGAPRPPMGHVVTVRFDGQGRVSGAAHCNVYSGTYALTADRLAVSSLAATRRACLGSAMQDEQVFLGQLADVVGIHVGAEGGLTLVTAEAAELGVVAGIHVR